MPAINAIKSYMINGIYHIYNRGVEKREIFDGGSDYETFMQFLCNYICVPRGLTNRLTFCGDIKLFVYCLMPNHFHLMLTQRHINDMTRFMRCLEVSYIRFFNKKYSRVGHLFQSGYRARIIKSDEDIIATADYIHLNPKEICKDITKYRYSSLRYYVKDQEDIIDKSFLLNYFDDSPKKYKKHLLGLNPKLIQV